MAQPSATNANGNSAARLLELIQMRLIAEAIYVVAALGIPDLLAAAPKSSEELAKIKGVNAPYLPAPCVPSQASAYFERKEQAALRAPRCANTSCATRTAHCSPLQCSTAAPAEPRCFRSSSNA